MEMQKLVLCQRTCKKASLFSKKSQPPAPPDSPVLSRPYLMWDVGCVFHPVGLRVLTCDVEQGVCLGVGAGGGAVLTH